jgi:methyl-accepting chemotaxis protein/methyl-accepting chemotaxis protein-1 (serine sensor receptor)
MTLKKKLFLAYGLMTALTLATGVTGIALFNNLSATMQRMESESFARLSLAADINLMAERLFSLERSEVILTEHNNPDLVGQAQASYEKDAEGVIQTSRQLRQLLASDEEKRMLDELDANLAQVGEKHQSFKRALGGGDLAAARQILITEYRPPILAAQNIAQQLQQNGRRQLKQKIEDASGQVALGHWVMSLAMLLCIAIGIGLVWIIRRLDAELRESIRELSEGSEQVSSAASQVSTSSQSLAQDTSEQAAMIEETSASSEEINSMARRNAENAETASTLLTNMSGGMERADQALLESVHAMDEMSVASDKISAIIDVIEKIAFQTNILALNAAVEAARAGEAGMGFAVVADEVRNLAQRCAQAAKDTSSIIEHSVKVSHSGKAKVQQVADAGRFVGESFGKIKILIEEIHLGSKEQGHGFDQISKAINQMEQRTQKSAANAEEGAAAAEELTAQSKTLRDVTLRLGQLVGASGAELDRRQPARARSFSGNRNAQAVAMPKATTSGPSTKAASAGVHKPLAFAASSVGNDASFDDSFESF